MLSAARLSAAAASQPLPLPLLALSAFRRCLSAAGSSSGGPGDARSSDQQPEGSAAPPPPLPPPLLPPDLQQPQQHWLDRYFPGARHWLEDKQRHWWIKGLVEGRSAQYSQLEGRQAELRALIEREYEAVLRRFAHKARDERGETHVQVAALVLASHKVLLPFLRDEKEVLQVITEHMGGRTQAALRVLLKATRFLHRDGYAVLASRLRGLQWDLGRGWEARLDLGERDSSLTITRCFMADLFAEAGQPHLAACCCCSQDRVWFEAVQYPGVEAGREAAISAGDPCCRFVVRRRG